MTDLDTVLCEAPDQEHVMALLEAAGDWSQQARPSQLEPDGDWLIWLCLAGRGWGKTRTGAEWVRSRVERGLARQIVIAAPTSADVRDIVVEGESGLLGVGPPHTRPLYEPSKRRVTWPNGARAVLLSADQPERFRGLQADTIWADELASWRYPDAWDQLMLGFRLGAPRGIVTTTPKPSRIIKELVKSPTVHLTRGSSFENAANLAPAFLQRIVEKYRGTRVGRQELYAEILEDVEGALVARSLIDDARVSTPPELSRIVVAIDPAVTSGSEADETGVVVVGRSTDSHAYVLEDLSLRATPDGWARRAVDAYHRLGADRIVVERNNGGEMCEATIRQVDPHVPITSVVASRGKHIRFEPVGALYEQGRIHHVGCFADLEDQLVGFTAHGYEGASSPDRADALVWAISELCVGGGFGWGDLFPRKEAA